MKKAPFTSVVVPVFNEAPSLNELYERIVRALDPISAEFEIIFVDDGSRDDGPEILLALAQKDVRVKLISFCRNFGQHAAVMAGFKHAKGEVIVTLDADLQNPPEEIPLLIEKINEGFDAVAGNRVNRKDRMARRILSRLMNLLISRLTEVKLNDYGCMLRAYRRNVIDYLLAYGEKSVYIPAFTSWLIGRVAEVDVRHDERKYGSSKYSMLRFLRQAFDLVTAYTLVPIQLISIIGAFFALVGFFLACYLMSFRLFFGTPSPFTTFISALLFFSGLIIFSMGIISEYLVRIHIETRKLPLYIIKGTYARDHRGESI